MSTDRSAASVIAERERLRKQLDRVVHALDDYVAELLQEVARPRPCTTSEDDPR